MSDDDNGHTQRVGADQMNKLREMVGGEATVDDDEVEVEVVDEPEEDSGSTRRVSASEMDQLQDLLQKKTTTEVPIEIGDDVLERVDALIPKMDLEDGSSEPLQRAIAVRQIFMTGLYAMESELGD